MDIPAPADVAARGPDINDGTYVISYSIPQDPEASILSIGRIGRGDVSGIAIAIAEYMTAAVFAPGLSVWRMTRFIEV